MVAAVYVCSMWNSFLKQCCTVFDLPTKVCCSILCLGYCILQVLSLIQIVLSEYLHTVLLQYLILTRYIPLVILFALNPSDTSEVGHLLFIAYVCDFISLNTEYWTNCSFLHILDNFIQCILVNTV